VDLNDLPSAFHSHVNQTDARDIRVTKSDGTTELPREVVFYTAASDAGELYFKYIGTLSGSTDTSVYLYYGNSGASDYGVTNTYGRNNVWDDYYVGVWHLNESGNGTADEYVDSTGTENEGQGGSGTSSEVPTQTNGKIGKAQSFDGGDEISISDSASLDITSNLTISTWIYETANPPDTYASLVGKGSLSSAYNLQIEQSTRNVWFYTLGTSNSNWSTGATISNDAWNYLTYVYNGSNKYFYKNTDAAVSTSATGSISTNNDALFFGNRTDASRHFQGIIDEVRISNTARLSTWISTEYNNQNSPGTFFNSFGTEETLTAQTATRTVSATDLSSYDSITYYVRSDRTGSFMRFQMGESASSEYNQICFLCHRRFSRLRLLLRRYPNHFSLSFSLSLSFSFSFSLSLSLSYTYPFLCYSVRRNTVRRNYDRVKLSVFTSLI